MHSNIRGYHPHFFFTLAYINSHAYEHSEYAYVCMCKGVFACECICVHECAHAWVYVCFGVVNRKKLELLRPNHVSSTEPKLLLN